MNMNISRYFLVLLTFCSTTANGQKTTVGNYTFPKDKAAYTGDLESGKPHGKGKTIFVNGDNYEGEYVKGKRQGYGVYTFVDGERYEGDWYQDHQHGRGTYYFANKNKYEGLWFTDYQEGEGNDVLLQR